MVDFTFLASWGPAFVDVRRASGSEFTHVAARPRSPHADWMRNRLPSRGIDDIAHSQYDREEGCISSGSASNCLVSPVLPAAQAVDVGTKFDSNSPAPPTNTKRPVPDVLHHSLISHVVAVVDSGGLNRGF